MCEHGTTDVTVNTGFEGSSGQSRQGGTGTLEPFKEIEKGVEHGTYGNSNIQTSSQNELR
jgi:hypothetical protein